MSEKLKNIINEIHNRKRNDILDLNISYDEYLSKDENNISFIEYILKAGIEVPDDSIFINSKEVAHLYCKYGKTLYYFNLTEEEFFEEIKGQRIIEYIIKKDTINTEMLQKINNHIEIIDILIKNKKEHYINYLPHELLEKLFIKNEDNKYIIELYLKNKDYKKYIVSNINLPLDFILFCIKENNIDVLKYANINTLMMNIDNKKTLLEYLLENGIVPSVLDNLPLNIDFKFIKLLKKIKGYKYINTLKEDILLKKISFNKTLLEDIIDEGYNIKIPNVYDEKTIKILISEDKLDFIENINYNFLLKKIKNFKMFAGNHTLLDDLIKKNILPFNDHSLTDEKIINKLYEMGHYQLLARITEPSKYNIVLSDGSILFDKLLENNLDIKVFSSYIDDKNMKSLLKYKRFDLLGDLSIKLLLKSVDNNYTYLDYLLDAINEGNIIVNLNKIKDNYNNNINDLVKFYICLAKRDMISYIEELTVEDLLEKRNALVTLLDLLLNNDKDLTFNKILSDKVKADLKIATVLVNKGFSLDKYDISPNNENFGKDKYEKDHTKTLGIGPIYKEGEDLLNKLYELFKNDNVSDKFLIDTFIYSYRQALITNYNITLMELKKLVEIKEKNMSDFVFNSIEEGAYFRPYTKNIYSSQLIANTLLHETGHALHHFLADDSMPNEFFEIIEKIKKEPLTLEKIEIFAKNYKEILNDVENIIKEECETYFANYYTDEKIKEIQNYLNDETPKKRQDLIDMGVDKEVVDKVLKESFTTKEYIAHQKRVYIKEFTSSYLRINYGSMMAISDIFDAIYGGKLKDGKLINKNGDLIPSTAGHGISYFSNINYRFDEIIADFVTIIKSNDGVKQLDFLHSIIGDELYNLIVNYYKVNILNGELVKKGKSL